MLPYNYIQVLNPTSVYERTIEDHNEFRFSQLKPLNSGTTPNRTVLLVDEEDQATFPIVGNTPSDIIVSLEGVIIDTKDDKIKIRLLDEDDNLVLEFPKSLFIDKSFVKYGAHIKYLIKTDEDGYRYQDFIPDETEYQSAKRDELLELLEAI